MIIKVSSGGSSGGALDYVLRGKTGHEKERAGARLIGGNVTGTRAGMKAQFRAFEQARPALGQNTTHLTLSFAPGERVADERAVIIATQLVGRLGYTRHPFVVVRHTDKEYEHLHIVASRVGADGSAVRDFQQARRAIVIAKELELEHGLQVTPATLEATTVKAPKRNTLPHRGASPPGDKDNLVFAIHLGWDAPLILRHLRFSFVLGYAHQAT